jgi:biofilm PGA synthesis N-glycosyltransferase PgaC
MRVLIVSPVRDEERFIGTTLECMCRQTVRPDRWVVVNDGSSDRTGEIVREYAERHPFITYMERENRGHRLPGQGVVEAFYAGLAVEDWERYDIIAKLDGDLEFEPDTLEKILDVFEQVPKAGIVGGVRYERREEDGPFFRLRVSKCHVGGPYKFYRRECFRQIGGLVRRAGWDGIDEIRAYMNGWITGEWEHIAFIHLRPTGMSSEEGVRKANMKYGDVAFYMGGYFWYFLLRSLVRSIEAGSALPGLYQLKGYLTAAVRRAGRESKPFRTQLKRVQLDNFLYRLRELVGGQRQSGETGCGA